MKNYHFAFFGTSNFSVIVLEELKQKGFLPTLIITVPDKPKGRKLILTPPEVKIWAEKENIPCIQPATLKNSDIVSEINSFAPENSFDFFIVVSYGKIIPDNILNMSKLGSLNVHPSLLPKLRGPSPIQSAILSENETGVTIMKLDAEIDHGPIITQKKTSSWDDDTVPYEEDLEKELGKRGGQILSEILPDWVDGKIKEVEQNHNTATFCQKIEKSSGELNLNDSSEKNLRKIRAYHKWPGAYYFVENHGHKMRIIVKRARIEDGKLIIERVVPEGKKEVDYNNFLNGLKNKEQ